MPTDVKLLSPEVEAARLAVATDKLRAKKQAQVELDAENKEMKKRLAATGPKDSKLLPGKQAPAGPLAARSLTRAEHAQLAANIAGKQKRTVRKVVAAARSSKDEATAPPPSRPASGPATHRLRVSELVGSCGLKSPASATALPPLPGSAPGRCSTYDRTAQPGWLRAGWRRGHRRASIAPRSCCAGHGRPTVGGSCG